jgi:hypothetical protein
MSTVYDNIGVYSLSANGCHRVLKTITSIGISHDTGNQLDVGIEFFLNEETSDLVSESYDFFASIMPYPITIKCMSGGNENTSPPDFDGIIFTLRNVEYADSIMTIVLFANI